MSSAHNKSDYNDFENYKSPLLIMIKEILKNKDKVKIVSDIAFQGIDEDDSNSLD